jgi:hypothetical protein
MYFKCKQTGNVYFYQYEVDILAMKEHHQYECLGETLPEEPKHTRKKKTEEE